MNIVVDMNLSPRWVERLSSAGLTAIHWSAIGAVNATDEEIIAYAKANDMVILTHDLDFTAILAVTGAAKPSVVQIRADDVNPTSIGDQVLRALQQMKAQLAEGALVSVDPVRARMKVLPLTKVDQ